MKEHHCQSIHNCNYGHCTCYPAFVPPRPWTRCDGTCFQRSFYSQNPLYIHNQISHPIVQPWSPTPFACNPSFNSAFYEPSHFEKIHTKHKTLDPSSHRVTVRPITPLHVTTAAAEAYRTTRTLDINGKDYLNANNQRIPSVPSKKCVNINNGMQASSTSFITTNDEQNSFTSETVSQKSCEYPMHDTHVLDNSSFPNHQLEEHLSDNPLSDIDESGSFQFLHHGTPESNNNLFSPALPSSLPPNIDHIKSNEKLVRSSRSNKSVPSLNNKRQKSSAPTSKSSLPLLNTRSTLDFGLLIHETSA